MKIFGLEIGKSRKDAVRLTSPKPDSKPISTIPAVKPVVLQFAQSYSGGRGNFISPEYDLNEIGRIEDSESFLSQSFKKKMGLMFKEGVVYRGSNRDTIQYIKTRLHQIAYASQIPEIELLKRTGNSLIRTSNAFVVKVRKEESSGGKLRKLANGKDLKPVAAYFPAAPETMFADLDPNTGKVMAWRHMLPGGKYKDFKTEDVIHFTIYRREGFVYGVPTVIPVIDDIRALRQIEENIETLLYQHLFPLFQYKVGTEQNPSGYDEEGNKEVDVIKQQIRLMPMEGGIVTTERHEIKAIGAEGRAIHAEGYLEHFKRRVIAGLGISTIDLGDGDTSNRSTAKTLSRALVDTVKDIQDSFEAQWSQEVVSELLLESTFDFDPLSLDNMVYLEFKEIDLENKIDMERHHIELWKGNGITYSEFRERLGEEPIELPEDPNDQDATKYTEWMQTHHKLIDEPINLIRAVDEPWSPASKAAAANRSLALTQGNLDQSKKDKEEMTRKENAQKQKAKPVKDHYLREQFSILEQETIERMKSSLSTRKRVDYDYLLSHGRTWATVIGDKMLTEANIKIVSGFNRESGGLSYMFPTELNLARDSVKNRIDRNLDRLVAHTIGLIRRRIDAVSSDVKLAEVNQLFVEQAHVAFDVSKYRTDFIKDVEVRKAYNFGRMLGQQTDKSKIVAVIPGESCCDRCIQTCERIGETDYIDLTDIAPFHPGCECTLVVKSSMNSNPIL